jgi:hypothetical protein
MSCQIVAMAEFHANWHHSTHKTLIAMGWGICFNQDDNLVNGKGD